jgi:hypothetical protein
MTRELGALNVVLAYYKLTDDIEDGDHGRGKRLWFRTGFRRAKKQYPEMVDIVATFMKQQSKLEREKTASLDRAAEPTASMMKELSTHFLKEHSTQSTQGLFYAIGKWIYLIDALDDYDKDKKKGAYNPFLLSYGAESREALMAQNGTEVNFLFDTLFYDMRENLAAIPFRYNRDLTDNIILRGLPSETVRVMKGEKRKIVKKIK